ncbi:ankyrin repeat domain-containing protein 17-like isoform X2 [Limulus polyphemus]|uniref:Ankyrin repeat domain-containing protein 17-like isoform X2 n=1 Tax=Limulus polyphemus TaxID=6850 RepID=A0ABM1SVL6_LIMPO|nr:ankyrin repeat domain-containing protein 17-like isoform X2 [Limulus polyphemus]XP_022247677.1 ankyrin repeat domain-containing protein 17-like isoform X2 [Limulus polyphemus]
MQNVVQNNACGEIRDDETSEVGKVHSDSSSPLSGNLSSGRGQFSSLHSNFMADLSDSEDDEVSEVESFILDQADLDEEPSKFLLPGDGVENLELHSVDPETRAELEAFFKVPGAFAIDKQCSNPEGLRSVRDLTSVTSALDEAAATFNRRQVDASGVVPGDGGRSLAEACSEGDLKAVQQLLCEGCNINEVTDKGESLLSLACLSGYYELVQLLLMQTSVEDRGLKDTTPLMEAASAGHVDIVKLLLDHSADVNAQTNQGNTPLMYACAGGHEEVVRVLLESGANVEDHNENGHTPLMEAASAGHVGVAKILVEHGASINTHSNEFKESALTLACYKGHLEMVRFLLEAGADQEHKTDEMHTALMEASMDGHVEVAKLLLDSGAQVNMPADSFESPLTLAACGGHVELATLLLERGANIEEVNDEGYTPLMEAAREGHEEMVALLLSQGADINAQTEETQETALTLACCGGFLEVAEFLIKAGADIELGASTPLMEAAQEGHLELVRYLINAGANVNAQTGTGDTALTYACENGHTDVADLLLQAGAELEHESEGGRTPLMKAARAGRLCTVRFLITKGVNVNKQTTNNDHTPLSLACAGGNLEVVELLLSNGADPTHKLKDNSTMLIEAAKGGHTTVVQLLLDYPGDLLSSPPPPPDLSQLTTTGLDLAEAPRVPPHGLQVMSPQEMDQAISAGQSYLTSVQSVPRIPEPLQMKDALQSSAMLANAKQNMQKSVQRKLAMSRGIEAPSSLPGDTQVLQRTHSKNKACAAAQTTSVNIQAEVTSQKPMQEGNGAGLGGGGTDIGEDKDLKPCEKLEACINTMMKKAERLNPSREEQIIQKQQILEELQRVERELQEKAQAQLYLSAQQQQQHHLQALAAASQTVSAVTSAGTLPPNSSHGQQVLLTNTTLLDMGPLPTPVIPDLSGSLLSLKSAAHHLPTPATLQTLHSQQLYQQPAVQNKSVNLTTSVSEHVKGRVTKQASKQTKNNVLKQQQQSPTQLQTHHLAGKNLVHTEEVEKMNLRNVAISDPQHLLQQASQQHFMLSDFSQNLTLRGNLPEGAPDTLIPTAGGSIRFTMDATQTHAVPIIDPVAVSQALALQHQQLQQQQLQQQQQQLMQHENKRQQLGEKQMKSLKTKNSKSQQTQQVAQHLNHQQLFLQQQQQTQVNTRSALSSTPESPLSLVSNLSLDTASILTLGGVGSPSFPVSLAVSAANLPSAGSISSGCGPAFAPSFSLEDGLMVAAPARTLHDTLGDIMTSPTTQLAGTQVALGHQASLQTHCLDPTLATSGATVGVNMGMGLTMASLPAGSTLSTSLHLPFHALNPTVTSAVPNIGPVVASTTNIVPTHHHSQLSQPVTPTAVANAQAQPPLFAPLDLDSQTDSNHDTALTLACAGGHEELTSLLLQRGANMEHRDKKGFTPLMLAATAGHAGVVEILINHGSDIEAQSERTKDTPLSLACSGGRFEVVEILLARGANKEHRNVSDYTPLSLAASGGYVNIIKLLLNQGAEINSRTGSKLGISPLMLAAMNGHTAAVRLLLDNGSDINAQIETNRNTALTLACFQGRHEVVSLLLDRKANVEHRAKTGLTPLMEAASGGYVEVGRVLLDKGADVNAPPVPSSRDTALTIAADKGHYRFVELLLSRGASVDVKNKKGNSPLWLAANGGHLDVVQLLVNAGADIDSQDNRKVSCLMAAFRRGHVKVVKWMVKHVSQYPSDHEMKKFISTLSDKELHKKCAQAMESIKTAKDRQEAEANKNATILLEELDKERSREESRKAAAARRREKKRKKKKERQEQLRAASAVTTEEKKLEDHLNKGVTLKHLKPQSSQSDGEDDFEDDDDDDSDDEDGEVLNRVIVVTAAAGEAVVSRETVKGSPVRPKQEVSKPRLPVSNNIEPEVKIKNSDSNSRVNETGQGENRGSQQSSLESGGPVKKKEKERPRRLEKKNKEKLTDRERNVKKHPESNLADLNQVCTSITSRSQKKRNQKHDVPPAVSSAPTSTTTTVSSTHTKGAVSMVGSSLTTSSSCESKPRTNNHKHKESSKDIVIYGMNTAMSDLDDFGVLPGNAKRRGTQDKASTVSSLGDLIVELPSEVALTAGLRSPNTSSLSQGGKSSLITGTSPKKGQKREEGWKEVVRRSKKVSVPSTAISRVIGRGGCNINTIREVSGAHIEVEKQKGQGDRTIIIRGSQEATRQANQLIAALIKEANCELSEIIANAGLSRSASTPAVPFGSEGMKGMTGIVTTLSSLSKLGTSRQLGALKSSSSTSLNISKATTIPPPSLPVSAAAPFSNQTRLPGAPSSMVRPPVAVGGTVRAPPFPSNCQNAWSGASSLGKGLTVSSNRLPSPGAPASMPSASLQSIGNINTDKNPFVRQLFPSEKKMTVGPHSTTTSTKGTVSYTIAGKSAKSVPVSNITVASRSTSAAADTKLAVTALSQLGGLTPSSTEFSAPPSTVQPFPASESSTYARAQNERVVNQISQTSVVQQQTKAIDDHPAMHSSFTTRTSSPASVSVPSSSGSHRAALVNGVRATVQSPISQVYTPFQCHLSKVVEHSMWGQKETKPNFASVAAAGVTSVAMNTQNSNPVQTSLSLSVPQTTDYEVDAAKAPGYRGNLHVSPSGSSSSSSGGGVSQPVSLNTNYGPIGSGPRSAPCTPPLGPIGAPSVSGPLRHATSPVISSPPAQSRSPPESHRFTGNELVSSVGGGGPISTFGPVSQVLSASQAAAEALYQSQAMQGLNMSLPMANQHTRLHNFPVASGARFPVPSPGTHTNTTFSQHTPLSSVGSMASEGTSECNTTSSTGSHVIQSNLNPNAPDFSSRASLLVAQHTSHGPTVPSRLSASYHECPPTSQSHANIIQLLATNGGNLSHQLPFHHGFITQNVNRYTFPGSHGHQNPTEYNPHPPPGPVGSIPPSMAAPGLNAESLRLVTTMGGFPAPPHPGQTIPHHMGVLPHQFANMAQLVGHRQNHRSASTTPSVGTSSKDGGSPVAVSSPSGSSQGSNLGSPTGVGTDHHGIVEDRKLPRPIGTERAQKKNPGYGLSEVQGIWSFGTSKINDIGSAGDWIHHVPSGMATMPTLSQEEHLPHMLHNYVGGRYGENLSAASEQNTSLEQTYQPMNAVAPPGGYPPFLNGMPAPHVLTTHLYSSHANGGLATGMEVGGEMWRAPSKMVLPNMGDNLSCDHKMVSIRKNILS